MADTPPPKKSKKPKPVDENDRPTVSPPFDVEAFARAATAVPTPPASRAAGLVSTLPPPESLVAAESTDRITITNEAELEVARAKSAQGSEPPQPRSALSIANARAATEPPPVVSPPRIATPTNLEAAVLGALSSSPAPEITERTIEDPVAEMRERYSLGDYTGALEMSELILAGDSSSLEAAECGESCRSVLEKMYATKIGSLQRVPMVIVPRAHMRWLSIDHRAGFILSLVDGTSTVEMILDVSGMPRIDALRILNDLAQQHILAFR